MSLGGMKSKNFLGAIQMWKNSVAGAEIVVIAVYRYWLAFQTRAKLLAPKRRQRKGGNRRLVAYGFGLGLGLALA